jgi:hypothetical protein
MSEEDRSPSQTIEVPLLRKLLVEVDKLAELCGLTREQFIAQVVDAYIATHRLSKLHGPEGSHYQRSSHSPHIV